MITMYYQAKETSFLKMLLSFLNLVYRNQYHPFTTLSTVIKADLSHYIALGCNTYKATWPTSNSSIDFPSRQ